MQLSTLLLAILPATTLALPHTNILPAHRLPRQRWPQREQSGSGTAVSHVALPKSDLENPDGFVLNYVAVGLGTQNYTCKASPKDASKAPVSAGAVAGMFDATALLTQGSSSIKDTMETILPQLVLSLSSTFGVTPDRFPSPMNMRKIGDHFFATVGKNLTATWVLDQAAPPAQFQGNKLHNVSAPADACPGTKGEGAVDWLELVDSPSGFSKHTSLDGGRVYRVETAGGLPPKTCEKNDGAEQIVVPYTSLYYFYGKKQQ